MISGDAHAREQADLEFAQIEVQIVLVEFMWDAARWLYVAQLYYGLR